MPTNFQFSSVQIAEIQNLRNVLARAENVSVSSGAADLYAYIFKCVTGMDASSASVAAISVMSIPDNQRLSATWLYGAIQVNSDSGTFSKVIREFNIHEGELRGKGKFSSAQLQEASNKVGINLADSILIASISGQPNPTYLYLPTVQEIGASDLNGVRDVLYPGNEARGSELYLNQAWPGIVMLGALGGKYTDRLLRFDDSKPIALDTLGDFKSMLFCWDSFKTAWDKTCVGTVTVADAMTTMNFSSAFIAQVLGEYSANGAAGVAGMVFNALINAQQPASGLSKAMSIISVTGANKFLDMLMGAIQGKALLGQTNDANFVANVNTFFGDLTPAQLQGIGATLMPTRAADIASLAQTDVNARAALMGLSLVKLQVSSEVASHLTLQSTSDVGGLTATWMADRASMLQAIANSRPGQNPTGSVNTDYVDLASSTTVVERANGTGANAPAREIAFGTSAADTIDGTDNAQGDRLYGMAGDDTLDGMTGNDYLEGGIGTDAYKFSGAFGKDKLWDADGLGAIQIDGTAITNAKGAGQRDTWTAQAGEGQYVGLAVYDDSNSTTGKKLVITRAGSTADTITIDNFDLAKALSTTGYLGLKLDPTPSIAVMADSGADFWARFDASLSDLAGRTSDLAEGAARSFTVYLSTAAKAGDTLTLALGALADKFQVILGDQTVAANGAVITLAEGQTKVSFALVEDGDIAADGLSSLKVTYNGQDASSTSNTWSLSLKDAGEIAHTRTGDQRAKLIGTEIDTDVPPSSRYYGTYKWAATSWAADGTLTGGVAEANFADVIDGTESNDRIDGKGGNDALNGRAGNDQIYGGDGDDLIGGGSGSDNIHGGAGNDYINSSSWLDLKFRSKPSDSWSPPGAEHVYASGPVWGIYDSRQSDGSPVIIWSGTDVPYGADGDVVDAGAGDDWVIASAGADRVQGGAGADRIEGLGGSDVLEGNDGDDEIDGDGLLKPGYMISTTAATHGADFIDGGAGNDKIRGGGGADQIYGGAGDDNIYADTGESSGTANFLDLAFHGKDYIDGEDGADYIEGGGNDDTLYGGAGKDNLWGDQPAGRLAGDAATNPLAWGNDYLDGESDDDQLVGGGGSDTLYGGQGNDAMFGDQDSGTVPAQFEGDDFLDGEDGNDVLFGGGGSDMLIGGAGDDYLDGGTGADIMDGGAGTDTYVIDSEADVVAEVEGGGVDTVRAAMSFTLGSNFENLEMQGSLSIDGTGNELDNGVFGNVAANTLAGGGGNDYLEAGAGNDVYVYARGDGHDTIGNQDFLRSTAQPGLAQAVDTVRFAGDIADTDVIARRSGDHLVLEVGANQYLLVSRYFGADIVQGDTIFDRKIDRVEFGNGVSWDQAMIQVQVDRAANNHYPTLTQGLASQTATAGQAFAWTIPEGAFVDNDPGDAITLSARLGDGSALPSWLTFDPQTRTFSGTPDDAQLGSQAIVVSATDRYGYKISTQFFLTVGAGNHAPVAQQPLPDWQANTGATSSFAVPANAFVDTDTNDALTYSAKLADGSALPAWITFDVATRTFTARPGDANAGLLDIRVTATDTAGLSASDVFQLTVIDVNDAPVRGTLISNQTVTQGQPFSLAVPGSAFTDPDVGDVLTWSATGSNGQALPSWLRFDAGTRQFSGTPGASDAGSLTLRLTATDLAGATASQTFTLVVKPVVDPVSGLTLYGTASADTLTGGVGADWIDGKGGADRMAGGQGNDTYIVDKAGDIVIELAGQGMDTIQSTVDFTLSANVETLVLTGTAKIDGTGNALDNLMTGNAGNNKLRGGAGNDTLVSNGGEDHLFGEAGNDRLVISASNLNKTKGLKLDGGDGWDTVVFDTSVANTTFTLDKGDSLKATGIEALDITGGGNNTLVLTKDGFKELHDREHVFVVTGASGAVLQLVADDGPGRAGPGKAGPGHADPVKATWVAAGTQVLDGVTYNAWTTTDPAHDVILVGQAVTVSLV